MSELRRPPVSPEPPATPTGGIELLEGGSGLLAADSGLQERLALLPKGVE